MMTRKVFQELQTSANDRTVFVGSPKRTSEFQKVVQSSVKVKMLKTVDKENVTVRRSKRKGTVVENLKCEELKVTQVQPKRTSKEQPKKSSKAVTKKSVAKNTKAKFKNDNTQSVSEANTTVLLNQSRLECYLSPIPSSSTTLTSEESAMLGNTIVSNSFSEEASLMDTGTNSRSYWQTIAEERQLALEKALLENELLADQVNTLQTENSQLKSALSAAEKVLMMEGLLN